MGMFFHDRGEAPPERPADPEVRRANLRRIGQLFKPYWRRLSMLLGLIVLSAGLGVLPAFLLRRVLLAIEAHDTRAVSINAAAMIVIAIVAGILGVIQTLLSNQVGQRVMHDLRAAVCSASRSPSSRAPARARCSRASTTTSAASRTSSRTPRRASPRA
jgi:ABC-type multidrug transport system fused ATPase/permease subunit